jgi:hypothetical protein
MTAKKINEIVWVCATCGSNEVEERVWRKCNDATCSGIGEADYEDNWCINCENNCSIITEEEYEANKEGIDNVVNEE